MKGKPIVFSDQSQMYNSQSYNLNQSVNAVGNQKQTSTDQPLSLEIPNASIQTRTSQNFASQESSKRSQTQYPVLQGSR